MLPATDSKFIQPIVTGIIILALNIAPSHVFSQFKDPCKVTIESVKCIKPSTGQDAYTAFLFKGIELALKAAKAVASGGASLTVDAAMEIGKTFVKSGVKAGVKIAAINQAKNIYSANKEEILSAVKQGGGGSDMSFLVDGVQTVLTYTSLQGIFNKVYGESPDDLYIRVNGNKVWPDGKSVSIKSQQELAIGAESEFYFERSNGFSIQLMEYDYGSGDDNLGDQFFEVPPSFMGTDRVVDQLFEHEDEGSAYLVTFRVETLLKHKFINNLPGSSWELTKHTPNGDSKEYINFGPGTWGVSLEPDPERTEGFIWKILGLDNIMLLVNKNDPRYSIAFNSENSFAGETLLNQFDVQMGYKTIRVSGTRATSQQQQTFQHRFINNLVGTSWSFIMPKNPTFNYTFSFGKGTIDNYTNPVNSENKLIWKVIGNDKIRLQNTYNGAKWDLTFNDPNNFSGYLEGYELYSGTKSQEQQQQNQQQQQTFQHRFINNLAGSSWNFSDPASGTFTFSFGQGTIYNVYPAGTFWDAVTWKPAGNDIIELKTKEGATMNIVFYDLNNFSGYSWYNKAVVATGTNRQQQNQQQQQQNLQHRFINNLVGTAWAYTDPGGAIFTFSFGYGVISNFSAAGTYWDKVTWKEVGTDIIELRTAEGATMNLSFSDQNNFSGTFWNNGTSVVTGTKR